MKTFRVLYRGPQGPFVSEPLGFVTACGLERHLAPYDARVITDTAAIRRLWRTGPVQTIRISLGCTCCPPFNLDIASWSPLGTSPPSWPEGPHIDVLMQMPVGSAAKLIGWWEYLKGLIARRYARHRGTPAPTTP